MLWPTDPHNNPASLSAGSPPGITDVQRRNGPPQCRNCSQHVARLIQLYLLAHVAPSLIESISSSGPFFYDRPSAMLLSPDSISQPLSMDSLPTEVAETIQAGHIRSHPDINFDIAPSTAADKREPVTLHSPRLSDDDLLNDIEDDEEDIPYSVLHPTRKSHSLPPLPDLRFEQSYLRSIANADTWWKVLLITARDQVSWPIRNYCFRGDVVSCGE